MFEEIKKAKGKSTDERGFILILALVTMVAMTVIGLSLIMNMTVDMQLSRNEREAKTSFQLAEAGVNEAMSRLHLAESNSSYIGEKTTDAGYRTIGWNASNALGRNFGYNYGGSSNSVDNMNYTVSIRYLDETNSEGFCDDNEVSPNTSANSTVPPSTCSNTSAEVSMYGQDFNIDSTVTYLTRGIFPVYRIVSTGTSNTTTRTIEAFVGASALNTDTEYGINTNTCIDANGAANNLGVVLQGPGCGCDPQITGSCATNKTAEDNLITYLGEDISSVKDMADEKHYCKNGTCSAPGDDIPSSGSIDDVVSDWGDPTGDAYSTLIYIDNSGGKEVSLSGNYSGRGILIVTGDLKLSGNLTHEGLVYVFGTLTLGGGGASINVTGGVMADNTVTANGNITVVYDQPTLLAVAKENSSSAILIWKRL